MLPLHPTILRSIALSDEKRDLVLRLLLTIMVLAIAMAIAR